MNYRDRDYEQGHDFMRGTLCVIAAWIIALIALAIIVLL